jgi:hypothetical protein
LDNPEKSFGLWGAIKFGIGDSILHRYLKLPDQLLQICEEVKESPVSKAFDKKEAG